MRNEKENGFIGRLAISQPLAKGMVKQTLFMIFNQRENSIHWSTSYQLLKAYFLVTHFFTARLSPTWRLFAY
jgi:hypothetical protein